MMMMMILRRTSPAKYCTTLNGVSDICAKYCITLNDVTDAAAKNLFCEVLHYLKRY